MALSSLSVVTNANRLRRWHPSPLPTAGQAHIEPHVETPANHQASPGTVATDPVCGMAVDPATASEHRVTDSGTIWFCSTHCAAVFDATMTPDTPATGQMPGGGTV
jgi:Cu+-exporting ATPase